MNSSGATRNPEPVTRDPELDSRNPQPTTSRLVVVVEDDEGLNRLICKRLARKGLAAAGVLSGADAIAAVQEHPGCLLLLDYMLPDMDGRQLLDKLGSMGLRVPFIVMTGHGDERVAVEMMKLGAHDYVVKQADFTDLLVPVVERVLAQVAVEERLAVSEQALKDERNRAQDYLDIAGVMLVAMDTAGRVTLINHRGCEVLGCLETEALGRNWFETFVPERTRADLLVVFRHLLAGEPVGPEYSECLVLTRSGEERLISWHDRLLRDEAGSVTGILSSGEDVTEHRQAEQEVRAQTALLKALVESPPDIIIFALDRDYRYTAFNTNHVKDMKKVYGVDIRVGMSMIDAINIPEVRARARRSIDRALAGESFYEVDVQPDLGIWYAFSWSPIHGPDGKVEGATAFIQDITRRKQVEIALAESELKYRRVFENSNDAMMLLDSDRFFDCNDSALRVFGFSSRAEFLGRHPAEVSPPCQAEGRDSRAAADDNIAAAFHTGRNYFEWLHLRADGTVFPADVLLTPLDFHGQKVLQATVRDISDRKRAEAALGESEERFRRAFEDSGVGKLLTGLDGRLLRVNRAFAAMLGYSIEELQSHDFQAVTHPDDVAMSVDALKRLQTGTEASARFEKRYLHRNDGVVWVDLSTVLLRDSAGRPAHFVADVQDISDRKRAEAALGESEERYRRLVEEMGEGIGESDTEERFLLTNPAAEELFGVPRGGLIGRSLFEFIDAEQAEMVRQQTARRRTGERGSYELEIKRPDGTKRTALVTASPQHDAQGRFTGSFGIFRDITERRRAEQQARAERDQWRRILDAIPDGAYVVGQDYELQYVNPSLLARAGPVNDRKCYHYFHGRTEPCPDCANPQVFAGGTTRREYTTQHGGVTFDIQDVPVAGHEGRPARLVFMRDVTERKQAELRDRQHLEDTALLRDTALGFIQLGRDADIYQYVADRLSRLVGEAYVVINSHDEASDLFTVRAIAGVGARLETVLKVMRRNPVGTEFTLAPEHRPEYASEKLFKFGGGISELSYGKLPKILAQTIEKTFDIGGIYAMGFHWQGRILGSLNLIMRRGAEVRDTGAVEAFVNQAAIALQHRRDADELDHHRDHLEDLVRERTAELEAANRELEAFSYTVSHDLRAPLRAMDGFTQVLIEDCGPQFDAEARGHLNKVSAAARQMAELIDDLLNLARIARLPLERKPVDLSELARTIAGELRATEPARRVEFVIRDGMTAQADPALAGVVLRNLLGNAWKFTSGHETARIEFGETRVDGERVWFVRDDGAGFEMDYVRQLFAPFHRLHTEHDFPGSGIGLAIVERIVRRHGGRVWIEAKVEKGATCRFTLEPVPKEA